MGSKELPADGVIVGTGYVQGRQVAAFSQFGFPKSHAAAFGLLAYQSAWLRHYHPTEYYVALFNNQPMGFYSLDALGRDARRNGIETLLPDVNRSRVACTAEGDDLRIGLGFVRGWGTDVAERVVGDVDFDEAVVDAEDEVLLDRLRRGVLPRPLVDHPLTTGGARGCG